MALVRAVTTIGGYTMLSRVAGFARDMLIARFLGAGMLSDAFFVAFKLPNFLRRLFAEGAFNAAFVPLFSGTLEEHGKERALQVATEIFNVLGWIVLLVVAFAEIFTPWIILAFAPGFEENPEKFALTVLLTRICFPYIFFISLVTLLSGVLNSINRFAAVAAAPILLNITLIAALLFLTPYMQTSAHAVSVGVMAAGIVQFVWLVYACKREGINFKLARPRLTKPVKKMLKLAAPVALGAGVAQINLLVDVTLASLIPNAVSWLYYADRLNELPIGVIGVAVGTALLPMLSKAIRAKDDVTAVRKLNNAIFIAFILSFPAAVALAAIPDVLIASIFQYGAFTVEDTNAVVPALIAYSFGLPAFIMVKVFAPGFYAREDTITPVKIAILCVIINVVGNLILMQYYSHVGLAMATTLSAWVNVVLMAGVLYKRKHFQPDADLIKSIVAVVFASAVMGFALLELVPILDFASSLFNKIMSVSILVISGMAIYGIITLVLVYKNRYFSTHVKKRTS